MIGTDVPRVDVPAKVNGAMKYGYDTAVPGMLHGKILRPPSLGATLQTVDFSSAQAMPGVVGVVHDGDFVGLAAERLEQAQAALEPIQSTWNELDSARRTPTIYDLLRNTPDQGQRTLVGRSARRTGQGAASGARQRPRPVCRASVDRAANPRWRGQTATALEVWASTQAPFQLQDAIAGALKRPAESITVHAVMSGGAFGRKVAPDAGIEAARLARGWVARCASTGHATRSSSSTGSARRWSIELEARAWTMTAGIDRLELRPVRGGLLCAGGPRRCQASANSGAHAADIYAMSDIRTTFYQSQSPLPVDIWRANGAPVNALARETALDELAEQAGVDPVTFPRSVCWATIRACWR